MHDWDDEHSIAILKNCRRVMGPDSTLLVVEDVIPPGDVHADGKLIDLNMLVSPGGQERTEAEYRTLYEVAASHSRRSCPPERARA